MSKYETRAIMVLVAPEGERIFTDRGFAIEVVDESGGEYLVISNAESNSKVAIEPGEWPHLRDAIDKMFAGLREYA